MNDQIPAWAGESFSLQYASLNDTTIPYLVGGDGPDLLMIHGLSASLDWWQHNAPALASRFRVHLVDLPGFGRLGHLNQTHDIQGYADWLLAFMDSIDLRRPHLVGLSMGGDIAVRVAARYPDRVGRLVLATPAAILPGGSMFAWAITGIRVLTEIPASLIPLAIRDGRWVDLQTLWRTSRNLITRDVRDLMPDVQAETLILASNNDPVIPPWLAESFADSIPNSRLAVFPGAGHLVMLSQPDQFNQQVISFLLEDDQESAGLPSATRKSPDCTGRQVMKNTT